MTPQQNYISVPLGSCVDMVKGYAFKSKWYTDVGVPIVKVSNFTVDSVDISNLVCIPEEIAQSYIKHELRSNDVVIQTVGSWPSQPESVVGKVIRIPLQASGSLLNQNAVKIIPRSHLDKSYLFYMLRDNNFKGYIVGTTQGAASQASITLASIRNYTFYLPPLPIQQKIAAVLSAYDDLIENNTRRIKILEEMAQAIYREWFVEFRFPGHEQVGMVESELGLIPQGWEVKSFGEVSFNFDRQRKPLSGLVRSTMQGEYPYYGAAKILDHINGYLFDGRYLLIAEDGSVITEDGKPVLQLVTGKFWVNNHTHVVQGKTPISTNFLYLFMSNVAISGYITGAAQPKINQDNLNRILILSPSQDLLERFDKMIEPIFDNIVALDLKNAHLRQSRDLLLPKLISGEVDVSELGINVSESK